MTEIFEKLAAPFRPDAISWRAQQTTKDGSKAMALAYIDARDVMARLDEALGPGDWQDAYHETAKGRVICTLSIRVEGEWIAKADGAGESDIEGEKGALSGAFKRAAVKWGIGRYLYDMPTPWVECESYEANDGRGGKKMKWKAWKPEGLRKLEQIAGKVPPPRTSEEDAGLDMIRRGITACDTQPELKKWWEQNWPAIKDMPYRDQAVALKDARKSSIGAMDLVTAGA